MTAEEGAITAVLGTSGCGKSTLLKNIIRLNDAWSGSVRMFDEEVMVMDEPEFNQLLKRVGVLFQNGALLNSITIAENVAIPLEQHTRLPAPVRDHLIRIKLALVELEEAIDKLPSELSGGMRKRAALARAMALDPDLLFCDEPSAGLDPVTAAGLDNLICRLRDQLGMSVIVITHHVPSIIRTADKIVYLSDGGVLFSGTVKEARSSGIEQIERFFREGVKDY
ncbi:ATP-binding cassette domain-containing protein [bacterium]|nr:ATP-binding cassette domain-containing protein [bacterium]